ncbi:MAG: hypothetical protein IH852_09180 [Bacteroidetes bacterium]|nr:hypothetical protein [Bacteroidota bacterium]
MAYKFYSGPLDVVTVSERANGGERTIARATNFHLGCRWRLHVFGDPQPDQDVTNIIHDHAALSALIDKRRRA